MVMIMNQPCETQKAKQPFCSGQSHRTLAEGQHMHRANLLCQPQLQTLEVQRQKQGRWRTSTNQPKVPEHTSPSSQNSTSTSTQWIWCKGHRQTINSHRHTPKSPPPQSYAPSLIPTALGSSSFGILLKDHINSTTNLLSLETASVVSKRGCTLINVNNSLDQQLFLIYIYL